MYFTKVFFILAIAITLCLNFSEAGNQAGKVLKEAGKKLPPVVVAGYASNSTMNVHVNTKPTSAPGSPKKG
ncbi:hypothetical protein FF38_04114 [Lucilia cuprina]|uniref:Uncharacterized protein n=1 Tax=Lucilia cuprina TaxID=7375 RepID=A0A0L0BUA2_LUCCU|nr:hypothetical protein CVS40_7406 [Lucilia cuprina]KNC22789.1 hypothetical protein FF38_04114 [Lucilia cuprina]